MQQTNEHKHINYIYFIPCCNDKDQNSAVGWQVLPSKGCQANPYSWSLIIICEGNFKQILKDINHIFEFMLPLLKLILVYSNLRNKFSNNKIKEIKIIIKKLTWESHSYGCFLIIYMTTAEINLSGPWETYS